jgi:hypothetical protein
MRSGSVVPYTACEPGWRTRPCVIVHSKIVRCVSAATAASSESRRSSSVVSITIAGWRERISVFSSCAPSGSAELAAAGADGAPKAGVLICAELRHGMGRA